jgi:predicted dehydrogenase
MENKLRYGMVGGGTGSFIGPVHRMAAELDGMARLVCGAFSSDAERSAASGRALGLDPARVYPDFRTMMEAESELPEEERMDFVIIVTPNHLHYEPALMALEHGFHVVCDKPLTHTLVEAEALGEAVRRTGLHFALTHTYTGYPMVKKARDLVRGGALGRIRKVMVTYLQGWLSSYPEGEGQKQAVWRTDPRYTGLTSTMGDIGTHAENLISYVTGLKIKEISAQLNTLVPQRKMDDDGSVILRYEEGVAGAILVSQVATGEENNVTMRIYGEKGGMEWNQMEPNTLIVRWQERPAEIYRTGVSVTGISGGYDAGNRLPSGHPEGFIEAFANIYKNFEKALLDRKAGRRPPPGGYDFPTVDDGIQGMKFLEKVVESSRSEKKWIPFT